jgi:hypothetical protein
MLRLLQPALQFLCPAFGHGRLLGQGQDRGHGPAFDAADNEIQVLVPKLHPSPLCGAQLGAALAWQLGEETSIDPVQPGIGSLVALARAALHLGCCNGVFAVSL